MLDLHIHTTFSDGSDTVSSILKKAQELNLEAISITDHETVDAYFEIKKMENIYKGTIIKGVELKAYYIDKTIDILGYNIDVDIMNSYLKKIYNKDNFEKVQLKKFNYIYDICMKYNLKLDSKNDIINRLKGNYATFILYNEIKKYEENKYKLPSDIWISQSTFSKKYIGNKDSDFYYDSKDDYLGLKDILDIIHNSGGLAFLAHLFVYSNIIDKTSYLKDIFKNYAIDGLECYYKQFSKEQINCLLKFAKENNKYICGGSDYHGLNKPNILLGVDYPLEVLKYWHK
ncbi:MAG: PHP domain-containing protein [Clostridia bacterium]